MSGRPEALDAAPLVAKIGPRLPAWPRHLHGSELTWAIAFIVPYATTFIAFALYPIAYGLWMARTPALYAELISDPLYVETLENTVLFVAFGVNVQMFLALLLSGFFTRRRLWIKALLALYILPWAIAAVPAYISFHWMLIGEEGLLNTLLRELTGIEGPLWLNNRWLALGSNLIAYIWKWMPFWTVIFLAGRTAIPKEIYEAAEIDGATGARCFMHMTIPLLANLYLVCTLLFSLWTVGDFTTVNFVSGGAPMFSSDVLATVSMHYAFDFADPALGMATVLSALPLLIPVLMMLMRKLSATEIQL